MPGGAVPLRVGFGVGIAHIGVEEIGELRRGRIDSRYANPLNEFDCRVFVRDARSRCLSPNG